MDEELSSQFTAFFILGGAALSIFIGYKIGKMKGQGQAGAWLGLLGPVGWIIAALLPQQGPKCPQCLGIVPHGARKCLHCGSEIQSSMPIECPYCGASG